MKQLVIGMVAVAATSPNPVRTSAFEQTKMVSVSSTSMPSRLGRDTVLVQLKAVLIGRTTIDEAAEIILADFESNF